MGSEDPKTPVQEPVKKTSSLQNTIRIVLFACLGVAIVALVIDQMARKSANAAFQALDAKLGLDHERSDISRDEVHKLVGREPDKDKDSEDAFEVYTWQGVRPQSLYVLYRQGADSGLFLNDVSLNEPPAGFVAK